jgi:uncharacterized protein
MRNYRLRLCAACLLISAVSTSRAQPTFDCAKAVYPDEQAICDNYDLARRNRDEDQAFAMLLRQTNMARAAEEARSRFIAARRKCSAQIDCIRREQHAVLAVLVNIANLDSKTADEEIRQPVRTLATGFRAPPAVVKQPSQNETPTADADDDALQAVLAKISDLDSKSADEEIHRPVRTLATGIRTPAVVKQPSQDETPTEVADDRAMRGVVGWGVIAVVLLCVALGPIFFRRKIRGALRRHHEQAIVDKAFRDMRREERRRTRFRSGELLDLKGRLLTECTICDRSKTGARVRLTRTLGPLCCLRFHDDVDKTTVEARVAWRRNNEVGLAFLE